ncbi:MAG: hypothetical protein LUI87_19855 [Lachnospiraceae bacterium]|nr:hypothetical protein [Lachnospiraceae bacterium]
MNYDLMFNLSLAALIVIVVSIILYFILRNPYEFPYYTVDFDVSGRRNVVMLDEIENYLPESVKDTGFFISRSGG